MYVHILTVRCISLFYLLFVRCQAFAKEKVLEQWGKTSWAKKAARFAVRRNLSDFDRFKVMVLRKQRSALVGKEFGKLRRVVNKAGAKKTVAKK